ncbi:hypothetical protein NX059_010884 [Plenodomus lindquistii]|nr:hypothetical protein NX059_010884 [Plenodomus lindquistii]
MIESLAAISLAGNIFQFVDYAIKLSQEAKKIHRAKPSSEDQGQTNDLKQIALQLNVYASAFHFPDTVAKVLNGHIENENVGKEVTRGSTWFRRAWPGQSTQQPPRQDVYDKSGLQDMETQEKLDGAKVARMSTCDREIVKMCLDCRAIATELLSSIARLRASNTTVWESFHAAMKTMRSEKELETLRQRLRDHRQKINTLLIVSMREKLQNSLETVIVEVRDSRRATTGQHEDLLKATQRIRGRIDQLFDAKDEWKEEILQMIQSDFKGVKSSDNVLTQHNRKYHENLAITSQDKFCDSMLDWIGFPELNHRFKKVEEAYKETFEWIFREPPGGKWANFQVWLESEDQPFYWITGKPAAGKSTLLKFINQDPRTKEYLTRWSGDKTLVQTAFYFWNSGTQMEMSEEAMIRTLLHGALSDNPELWATLFPSKMEEFLLFTDPWGQSLTYEDVNRAFELLVDGAGERYSLFLLIDGLDEFGGQHEGLVTRIKSLQSPHVKVCFSSRSWTVFEDGFRNLPRLRLEDVTYNDIRHYVTDRFQQNEGFKDRRKETPQHADDLINAITERAQGVFLWVRLVSDSLLKGLTAGEHLEELHERLETVPKDLGELFEKILTYVEPGKLKEMVKILHIIRCSKEYLTLLDLSYAEDPDRDIVAKVKIQGPNPSEAQAEARSRIMRRRLRACCQGLIEAEAAPGEPLASASVTYLHRTVRDWFETEAVLSRYRNMTDAAFSPWVCLFNAYAIRLKQQAATMWCRPAHEGAAFFWKNILYAMEYASQNQPRESSVELMLQLDTIAVQLAQLKDHKNKILIERHAIRTGLAHWSATRKTGGFNTSFLHLAIQLQLFDVVDHLQAQAKPLQTPNSTAPSPATMNLLLATLTSDLFLNNQTKPLLSIYPTRPSAALIALFLAQGADPNFKIEDALKNHGNITGEYSPWEAHLRGQDRETQEWVEISQLFLKHGADPALVGAAAPGVFPEEIVALAAEVSERVKREKRGRRRWVAKLGTMPQVGRLRVMRMAVLS